MEPIPTPCYCAALRKATRRLTAAYDAALRPVGITLAQFSLLRTVSRNGPLSLTDLARRMELDRSTAGRNVRVVQRLGFLQAAATADLREAAIELSPAGRAILAEAMPLWAGVQAAIETRLGPTRIDALIVELGEIGAAPRQKPDAPGEPPGRLPADSPGG